MFVSLDVSVWSPFPVSRCLCPHRRVSATRSIHKCVLTGKIHFVLATIFVAIRESILNALTARPGKQLEEDLAASEGKIVE